MKMPSSLYWSMAKLAMRPFFPSYKWYNGGPHAMIKKIAGVLMDTQLTQRQPITEHDTLLFVIVHFARHQNNFVIFCNTASCGLPPLCRSFQVCLVSGNLYITKSVIYNQGLLLYHQNIKQKKVCLKYEHELYVLWKPMVDVKNIPRHFWKGMIKSDLACLSRVNILQTRLSD